MSEAAREKIAEYLSAHDHMRLATASPDGVPLAHTVSYASEGAAVYFGTDQTTRKMQNIMKNPKVAYTVDENYKELSSCQGVQMEGTAAIVTDAAEAEKAAGMLLKKFPFVADFLPDPNMVLVKVTPMKGIFIDNPSGVGHRDTVTF